MVAQTASSTSTRRWFQFSLRSFLIVVIAISAAMGLIARKRHYIAERRRALEEPESRFRADRQQPGWRVWLLGDDSPQYANSMCLMGDKVTDDTVKYLEDLTELRYLNLYSTKITAAGWVHLRKLTNLESFNFDGTLVTDEALACLGKLTLLRELELSNIDGHTPWFTDQGLAHLKDMTRLEVLSLDDTDITDAGLAHLQSLKRLSKLSLCDTKVSDAGLVHLRSLINLEELNLSGTQITDAGLAELRGLASLKHLVVARTKVTEAGLRELTQALPKLQVRR